MRSSLFFLLCSGLLALVAGFTKEDHEIFRLKDEIAAFEGSEVTFYDFLGVKPSATQEQITKASRKKGRTLHPDKAKQSLVAARAKATSKPLLSSAKKKPGINVNKAPSESEIQAAIKQAEKRYARLGVITEILKGPSRERYDYFLNVGFPAWRGTGYYYARFRPGLGSVLIGLFAFGGGAVHYGILYLSWKRHREFVERVIRDARKMAWGDESGIRGIPGVDGAMMGTTAAAAPQTFAQENGAAVLNRRQKRMQERETKRDEKKAKGKAQSGTSTPIETEPAAGPQGAKKRVVAPNGKVMVVDSVGNVFLEEEDEEGEKQEFLLDPNELPKPTLRQTVLVRLPMWAYDRILGKVSRTQEDYEEAELNDLETTGTGEEKTPKVNGAARRRGKGKGNGKAQ